MAGGSLKKGVKQFDHNGDPYLRRRGVRERGKVWLSGDYEIREV